MLRSRQLLAVFEMDSSGHWMIEISREILVPAENLAEIRRPSVEISLILGSAFWLLPKSSPAFRCKHKCQNM